MEAIFDSFENELSDTENEESDPHLVVKQDIAIAAIDLLHTVAKGNPEIQESSFFDFLPGLQKYFTAGIPDNKLFNYFKYLIENCHTYADYKESSKQKIIFRFIRKLHDKSHDQHDELFKIMAKFCLANGKTNQYNQKLMHDLFFLHKDGSQQEGLEVIEEEDT